MQCLIPRSFGLPEEPSSPAQAPPTDGNPMLSPAGMMYSTLLQLRRHVETKNLEQTTLTYLVQRLKKRSLSYSPRLNYLNIQQQVCPFH